MVERRENMKSENKRKSKKKTNTYLWTSLKWYWFLVAAFYFLFILPKMFQADAGLTMEVADVLTLLFQVQNIILSGLMIMISPLERTKVGVADIFLKIAAVQQFIVGNIFGLLLTVFVWYRLPYKIGVL